MARGSKTGYHGMTLNIGIGKSCCVNNGLLTGFDQWQNRPPTAAIEHSQKTIVNLEGSFRDHKTQLEVIAKQREQDWAVIRKLQDTVRAMQVCIMSSGLLAKDVRKLICIVRNRLD